MSQILQHVAQIKQIDTSHILLFNKWCFCGYVGTVLFLIGLLINVTYVILLCDESLLDGEVFVFILLEYLKCLSPKPKIIDMNNNSDRSSFIKHNLSRFSQIRSETSLEKRLGQRKSMSIPIK